MYFNILNHTVQDDSCDRQTDRQMGILLANAALNYFVRRKQQLRLGRV